MRYLNYESFECKILTRSLSDVLIDLLTDFADILMFTETHLYQNHAGQFLIQVSQFDHIVSPPENKSQPPWPKTISSVLPKT